MDVERSMSGSQRVLGTILLIGAVAFGQQPNLPWSSMTIDGAMGPPYPIQKNVRTSLTSTFTIGGLSNSAFAIFQSGNGQIQPNAAVFFGDKYDMPLSPLPLLAINGFASGLTTGSSGSFSCAVTVPANTPIGLNVAFQTIIADSSSPFGCSLTAATRATVTQG